MKKILIVIILVSLWTEAYETKRTYWSGSGSTKYKAYVVECNNGKNIVAQYYPSSDTYYDASSNMHKTLSRAINNSCKKNKKFVYIKKGSFACPTRETIQDLLGWNGAGIAMAKMYASGDYDNKCFYVHKSKVEILQKFSKESYISKCGSAKSKKVTRIDSYVKVTDQRNIYYVRSSDLSK